MINRNEPPSLLRNDVSGDLKWIKVRFVGTKWNRIASDPSIQSETHALAVVMQSSFYSFNDRRLHFGLKDSANADLEIRRTNGPVERFKVSALPETAEAQRRA